MGQAVNLVVSCTNRKRYETALGLAAHQLVGADMQARLRTWKDRLTTALEEKYQAEDLYIGEHWSVVRDILSLAGTRGWDVRLWICSAGYGLIRPIARIHSYQVTFASGTRDSVTSWETNAAQKWWKGICSYSIPGEKGVPRSLTKIAQKYPRTPMVVALSADYLNAVENDLLAVLTHEYFRRHLAIISCGTKRELSHWQNNLLPCDGGLSANLGGTLTSLNARVARFLFESPAPADPTVDYWAVLVRSLERQIVARPLRIPQSDAAVSAFIRDALQRIPSASRSRLLEEFRATGKACEQKRFGELYMRLKQGAQAEIHG
jgi:hypothetical protein